MSRGIGASGRHASLVWSRRDGGTVLIPRRSLFPTERSVPLRERFRMAHREAHRTSSSARQERNEASASGADDKSSGPPLQNDPRPSDRDSCQKAQRADKQRNRFRLSVPLCREAEWTRHLSHMRAPRSSITMNFSESEDIGAGIRICRYHRQNQPDESCPGSRSLR